MMLIMRLQTNSLSNTDVQKYVNCHNAASNRRKPAGHDGMYLGLRQVWQHRPYSQWCVRLHSTVYVITVSIQCWYRITETTIMLYIYVHMHAL